MSRELKIGNVVYCEALGGKRVIPREGLTLSMNEEFICEKPHEDGDFSYICGNKHCRCYQ